LANLEEEGIVIDQYTWRPADDKATVEALARGDSMGVFYIESPAMRQLQKKTGRGDFEHIIIHSSIIRPAANKFISEYVRRLKGGKWENLHPRLKKILDETYGILCYQEDVSKTAVALAGFNEVDADKLRKVIAKKAGAAKLAVYKDQFFAGCRNNGVDEGTIIKIWEMMLSFDGYSFCKPHSASYAMVSFQSAYLRVHYPAEFMAAVISNRGGYYRPGAYISEARRMGLLVEGPDINSSRWKYYGSGRRVIIGFLAVKGLSASGAESIIAERERGGEYRNLNDFSRRVKSGRDDIIALCPAGAFDSIAGGLSRSMQARRLLTGNTGNKNGRPGMKDHELFETGFNFPDKEKAHKIIPHSPSFILHSLWEEYRALGFLRQVHTLALWKDEIAQLERIKARRMAEYQGCHVRLIGWPITQKEVWTKDGLTMSFLSFEDETAMYETVLFPDVYSRYNKLLFDEKPLVVYGLVCNDQGAITLEVTKIEQVGGGKI
ncbi:MAG: DNA polymerase III subunit alpha, partial [Treponema sp.]|nr:DNA polymerase III subunit alpha [Treponema sp.]